MEDSASRPIRLEFGKGRVESLTDGIFAFGMTLLVLGVGYPISVQSFSKMPVDQILIASIPYFVLYMVSFLILAAFWVSHHVQFHHLKFIDRTALWLNILSLMFVAFVPFTSSLAGFFYTSRLAAAVFEVHLLVIGLLYHVQWRYATHGHRLVDPRLDPSIIGRISGASLVIPAFSVAGLLLAIAGLGESIFVYFLVPVVLWIQIHH
ncbi:MAG TPA: TMEM175 family protein [Methanomicrobiales archaeon]|nr:TMEM175 family protein [Methanomicrobiales archaeon]